MGWKILGRDPWDDWDLSTSTTILDGNLRLPRVGIVVLPHVRLQEIRRHQSERSFERSLQFSSRRRRGIKRRSLKRHPLDEALCPTFDIIEPTG